MDKVQIPCPYKSNLRKICVHKGMGQKRTRKRRCGYSKDENCPLYKEWIEQRKRPSEWLKRGSRAIGDDE